MIASVIEQLRYVGLFLILFAAGLGLPVPEEVPIVAAGILSHTGVFRWWLALLGVAAIAAWLVFGAYHRSRRP